VFPGIIFFVLGVALLFALCVGEFRRAAKVDRGVLAFFWALCSSISFMLLIYGVMILGETL
jgi:hypothetical protein